MDQRPIIVWYRNDLRVDDHEPLHLANRHASGRVLPVYCVDPRHFEDDPLGFPRSGAHRTRFLLESLASLRAEFEALGSTLHVLRGRPEDTLPAFAKEVDARGVYFHTEVGTQEADVADALTAALSPLGVSTRSSWGATLYHLDDVPYRPGNLPDVFTTFRKATEAQSRVRPPRDAPERLAVVPAPDPGALPMLGEFGHTAPAPEPRAALTIEGGVAAAHARLERYFWQDDALRRYKETRNGLLGANYSSKFSPWLAFGCISPRRIWQEVQDYERERVRNDSTYWLIFELLWRDYFRLLAHQSGADLFKRDGIQHRRLSWSQDRDAFEAWRTGQTGYPFVDANMRELAATGFMSNRGRQNVASFLSKTLNIDWRWGARWFESTLIDHDVASNYGNWQYVAGVGTDPRDRAFNVVGQGRRYDANGKYVRTWVPELSDLPNDLIHEPFAHGAGALSRNHGVQLGADYPTPIIDPPEPRRNGGGRNNKNNRGGRNRGRRGRR